MPHDHPGKREQKHSPQIAANTQPSSALKVINMERAVIGAILIEANAFPAVVGFLEADHFQVEAHKHIYRVAKELYSRGDPIDFHTILLELKRVEKLKQVGGGAYLAELTERVASRHHVEYHARAIVEVASRQELIRQGHAIIDGAQDMSRGTFTILDEAQQGILGISANFVSQQEFSIASVYRACFEEIDERAKKGGVCGVSTGFRALDSLTGGWKPQEMSIVAGRPGMGKSALIQYFALQAAVQQGVPVAFFSLEMGKLAIGKRLMSACSGVSHKKLVNEVLSKEEYKQAFEGTKKSSQAKLFIEDRPNLSLLEFRSVCRRLKFKHNIQIAFVDYLQLLRDGEVGHNHGTREQQVGAISRGLKAVANTLEISVIVAAQLSRACETRGGDRRPQLSDLRESGSLEQDADQVIFLYRDEYYGYTEDAEGGDTHGRADIILSKQRDGPTGKVKVLYDAETTSFQDSSETF